MSIRNAIKLVLPFSVLTTYRSWKARWLDNNHMHKQDPNVFDHIYDNNAWGSQSSVSGPGSEERETEEIRALLPNLIQRWQVKSILDAPCGDFSWMRLVDLGDCYYTGVDVVEALIAANQITYTDQQHEFFRADLKQEELPKADLILCRDCLIHLSFKDAWAVLANFKASGATYLLATTNPAVQDNTPIITGGFRNLNLCLPPFNFPEPLELHRDRYRAEAGTQMIDPHKSVGLWRFSELPIA